MNIKILLVEDEEHIAKAIKLNLELENYQVSIENKGKSALKTALSKKFDLIILDVMLPEMDGFAICSELRNSKNETPILFLTAKGTSTDRVMGLKLGADDFLTKPFELEELLLRIKNLLKRTLSSLLTELNNYEFEGNSINFQSYEVVNAKGEVFQLSKREMELLKILIQRKNEVVSRDEILDLLWADDALPTPRTIDNFILTYRKIFEADTKNPIYFFSIRGVGYKFSV